MRQALYHVIDTIDLETFLLCGSEEEGKRLAVQLASELGLNEADVMFVEFGGPGARVRVRGSVNKPGSPAYTWLGSGEPAVSEGEPR